MGKKKDVKETKAESVIKFMSGFCTEVSQHNTAWEAMISGLTDEELEKFARLWAPAVEYAASRMEIYRIHERWD